ncbi:hypothetical protein SKAU_G00148320 [Synaphobranchus kaupii]|uniref:Uncharacterized protein n=1 Tax=Synaphobranchus kaupii TaxID=118154 RepID=A0A9Q1FUB2_SYNKA|nr:hypothetical protein SKAU_G00148320 [Synaphobranchus kaupii]
MGYSFRSTDRYQQQHLEERKAFVPWRRKALCPSGAPCRPVEAVRGGSAGIQWQWVQDRHDLPAATRLSSAALDLPHSSLHCVCSAVNTSHTVQSAITLL